MKSIKNTQKILEKKAVKILEKHIGELSNKKDKVVLGISGGRSVKGIFRLLKDSKINWKKVHIFLVDERMVPLTSSESNYSLAKNLLLGNLLEKNKIPLQNLHPFNYNAPVSDYTNELKAHGGKFDIILLSSGEDGHIASLFPKTSIDDSKNYFLTLDNSPKPPKKRMSASKKLLEKSNVSILLFFGDNKKAAHQRFKKTNKTISECPAKLVMKIKNSYVLVTS